MLWECNPMNGKRRCCLVQMKWIRRSSPATWQSRWFKSRHCAVTVMLGDYYEWSCDAMRLISDLQWVTLPLGANVEKFEDLRHWRFNAVEQRVDTVDKTVMLEDLYPTHDGWFFDDMRMIFESQGETFLLTAMIWRNLKISASNVTTQLIQESTPRKNCNVKSLISEARWILLSLMQSLAKVGPLSLQRENAVDSRIYTAWKAVMLRLVSDTRWRCFEI